MAGHCPTRTVWALFAARVLIAASLGVLPAPAAMAAAGSEPKDASTPWPVAIHTQMARIGAVEFALRRAAGDLCAARDAATGVSIDSLQAYAAGDQTIVHTLTGLGDAPQVIAVEPGSPAERAGIQAGDDLTAVNGVTISDLRNTGDHPGLLADEVEERIAATAEGELVVLHIRRAGVQRTLRFAPARLCSTRFILKTGEGLVAYSDSRNVAISAKLVAFARNDDELAIFASHELGHIIARDDKARSLNERRAMEDRADLLGVDLMRCAGYDPARGMEIWQRYNARDWLRWLRDGTHRNVRDRIARMTAHLAATPMQCPPSVPPLSASN